MKRHQRLIAFIGQQLTKVLAELVAFQGKLSPEEKPI
jgi:hypothetical protein